MITDSRPLSGTLADRYRLREVVGRGAMGEVWSATDLRLERPVAVKVLNAEMASEAGVRERFVVEARSAARLTQPNVVHVYDSGEQDGTPFLVMELLPGRTLEDELALETLEPERARRIGIEVLSALAASHEEGILHRDIKPGNVLLTTDGTAKVGDFGIAKSTEGLHLTSTGLIVGTAAYLAPERVMGQPASLQTDIYAVGVLLYEALSGRQPFRADTPIGVMQAIEAHDVRPLSEICPGLDPGLVATVERAMAKDPSQRFASAADMAAALQSPTESPAPAPAPEDPTLLDVRALDATQGVGTSSPTQVLASTGTGTAELGLPASSGQPNRPASARRRHPGAVAAVAVAALAILVILIGTRSSSGPGAATTPTVTAETEAQLSTPDSAPAPARQSATTLAPAPSVTDPVVPSQESIEGTGGETTGGETTGGETTGGETTGGETKSKDKKKGKG